MSSAQAIEQMLRANGSPLWNLAASAGKPGPVSSIAYIATGKPTHPGARRG